MAVIRPEPQHPPGTLVELLRERSREHGGRTLYSFLRDGESEYGRLTYEGLERRARAVGARLQEAGLGGERVLLLFSPGLEFVTGFFGALYAGCVAIPCYPPGRRGREAFASILADSAPRTVLTSTDLAGRREAVAEEHPGLSDLGWLTVEDAGDDAAGDWRDPGLEPGDLAFLQYTSGSTSSPKGVMISHGNLLHNEETIHRAFGTGEGSVIVSWLPLYHDMGLIGGVLQPLYAGARCILMSPVAFLQRPRRWLAAISRHRATVSGGPNFAYDLCVRRIAPEDREGLDLESWAVAFSGAEPVRAETLDRFHSAFADRGFARRAFYPCYGLAESTLFVSGGERDRGPKLEPVVVADGGELPERPSSIPLVSCGRGWNGQHVEVVDPETRRRQPEGEVGEIWVSGPSVALGYWRNEEATAATFDARLADGSEGTPFLRTGDLGLLRKGLLFVTGRRKDLIIIRGQNHYPQDVEHTVEGSHAELRPGCGAAFSVDVESQERLVVVQEVGRRAGIPVAEVAGRVRQAVAEVHEVPVHHLVLVRPGSVPKTTSGKVRRRATRDLYLRGELPVVAESALDGDEEAGGGVDRAAVESLDTDALEALPAERRPAAVESFLRGELARILRLPPSRFSSGDSLAANGLDSLAGLELAAVVEGELGARLDLRDLLSGVPLSELAARVAEAAGAAGGPAPAPPEPSIEEGRPRGEPYEEPATRGQKALWFLHRLDPSSAAYNVPVALWLDPSLDVPALGRALHRLAVRHPALRATFGPGADGDLVQRIGPDPTVDLEVASGANLDEAGRRAWAERAAYEPFDLAAVPGYRVRLLELTERYLLVLTLHHVVCDFWSLAVLGRELAALYREEAGGAAVELGPVPPSLGAFARREHARLEGEEGERLWSFWSEALAGDLPRLELPTDRPRPASLSDRGGSRTRVLDRTLSDSLRALARRHDATLFATLAALFDALLFRVTGQTDLLVGTPAQLRSSRRTAGLVGYLVNPVVLRTDAAGDPAFEELLRRVRDDALAAFAHRGLPFPLLAERLQPDRDPSRSPVFQVMLGLQKAPPGMPPGLASFALGRGGPAVDLGGLVAEPAPLAQRTAQFDLELVAADAGEELALSLIYSADLFEGATAERLLSHLRALAASAAGDPGRTLGELSLLTLAERHHLLHEGQGRRVELPAEPSGSRIAARSAEAPDAVALRCGDRALSYGALARRVERLAAALAARGVAAEEPVAVLADRSPELVIAFLALLRAGGAYTPLDPRSPDARLHRVLDGSGARLLLVGPGHRRRGEELRAARDGEGGAPDLAALADLEAAGEAAEPPESREAGIAYVFYTSGSTGLPKGAMVEARGMLNHLEAKIRDLGLAADDTLAQNASQAFDISVWQMLAPLLVGGTVEIFPDDVAFTPERLWIGVAERRVTVLEVVPSMLAAMLDAGPAVGLEPLRWLIPTGEALPPAVCRDWLERFPHAPVVNAYGPTECSDDVTHAVIDSPPPADAVRMPIGVPLINIELYVLDAAHRVLPVGVPGELQVGGVGVGRGYRREPRRTAEAFVPHPFGRRPGARLYRTGDLARRLPDGSYDFLGRLDHQVKVRGHRLELGEIEAALADHPAIREAVVLAVPDGARAKRLAAYAVPRGEARPGLAEVRELLAGELPDYMLPAALTYLDDLPRTATGKVDRQTLPEPAWEARRASAEYRAPRTRMEEWVAEVWRDLLAVERVGLDDDFFELGGHSLLATRTISRIRERTGVDLPLRALFQRPTVAGLVARIEGARGLPGEDELPPLEPGPRDGELPLLFSEERLWFLDRLYPESPLYLVPAALRLEGPLDAAALERALGEIVRRQEALRTGFTERDGRPRRVIEDDLVVPLRRVSLEALPEEERLPRALRLIRREGRRPFDLSRPPLVRFLLVRLAPESHIALLNFHHVISDGWSMAVLLRELSALYPAFRDGRASPLPELEIQLTDYAAWVRRLSEEGHFGSHLAYWKELLQDEPPELALPVDHPDARVDFAHGARAAVPVPQPVAEGLTDLGNRHGTTLFMGFLAAFQILLHRYAGLPDLVVGTPTAGRGRMETEELIGQLINTVVLRSRLAPGNRFLDHLLAVRRNALEAFAHQEVPFEMVVEAVQPKRAAGRNPLFRVLFDFQDLTLDASLPGLDLEVLDPEYRVSKLDLSLYVERSGERFTVFLEYPTDLFTATTVERMGRHYLNLLAAAVEVPERAVASLPLLAAAERHQTLVEWNDTGLGRAASLRLEGLFEAWAERRPDAVALVDGDRALTYSELDARAASLAARLRAVGVGPESPVLAASDRSAALAVAPLAVLKAGGVFVPLDPDAPLARIEKIVQDVRPAAALCAEPQRSRLAPLLDGCPVLPLGGPGDEAVTADPGPPAVGPGLDALAYAVFTSGSTGRPKGVMVPHRAIVDHCLSMVDEFGLEEDSRALQFCALAFDVVFEELFPTWAAGATVVLRPPELFSSFAAFERFLEERRVTTVNLVASYWHEWARDLAERGARPPSSLRFLLTGAEAVSRDRLDDWLRVAGQEPAWRNGYGPTETAVGSTLFDPASYGDLSGLPSVPIGRPNESNTAYLLDAGLEPVPSGVVGHLHLGGTGVARGYLGRPATTAGAFLPDPFSGEAGARVYRTGDRVVHLPDGNLLFVGRIDEQVKVRGMRIELGEIETELARHPAVVRCAVVQSEASQEAAVDGGLLAESAADPASLAARLVAHAGVSADELLARVEGLAEEEVHRELEGLGPPARRSLVRRRPGLRLELHFEEDAPEDGERRRLLAEHLDRAAHELERLDRSLRHAPDAESREPVSAEAGGSSELDRLAARIGALAYERRELLALRLHRARSEAAGEAVRDRPLVAYFEGDADADELAAFLRGRLAPEMVPGRFVRVDRLPTLSSGKVDRRGLALRPLAPAPEARPDGPRPAERLDRTHRVLSEIWKELLHRDRVEPGDDFFDLGGHSLMATRLVSRVRQALGVELDLMTVFEHPTLADLAAVLAPRGSPAGAVATETGPRAATADEAGEAGDVELVRLGAPEELSFSQERLHFLDRLEPGNTAYNIAAGIRLRGELWADALLGALREVVRRHEVLRTVYALEGGRPVPRLLPAPELEVSRVELAHLPEERIADELVRLGALEAGRPFDLATGPLLRAVLLHCGERDHALLLTVHHIAFDGWSLGILLDEVQTIYAAAEEGERPRLPELSVQYSDFASWQRRWLSGERRERLLDHWRGEVTGAETVLELPTDRPRPAALTYRGSTRFERIPRRVAERLLKLSRSLDVTLFMTLLGGFQALLARTAGQPDVLVGSPIAHRTRAEVEGLIGFFVNTLVLRGDLGGDPTVAEHLARVRETTLGAYRHQDLPFEMLVEAVAPERDTSRNPLFQAMFALQNTPEVELELGDVELRTFPVETGRAMFDLTLEVTEEEEGLSSRIEYSTDLFDATTVQRLHAHYVRLLEALADDPELPVSRLPLLSPAEWHQVAREWASGRPPELTAATLNELVAAQAERTPDRVAAVRSGEHLTYGGLRRRAGRIAARLLAVGVGPEAPVAVLMEPSVDRVAALLGVLAAGGAYVPLDPAYPPRRLRYLFEDSGAAALVTEGELAEGLAGEGRHIVRLDADEEPEAPVAPEPVQEGGRLAYLIYTSGSMGAPKGVMIEHRQAAALVDWARREFVPEELQGTLAATSICFDLSVFEHFAPLATGGTLFLADNVLELAELPERHRVTLVNSVPSAVAELLERGPLPESARTVALAGEALVRPLVERLYEHEGVRRVLDLYGPSEDTTYSTGAVVPAGERGRPSIGRPVDGTRSFVLDGRLRPVSIGVVGELFLTGVGTARGYLRRPARTAESFLPNPLPQGPGERVYATGDLVRLLPDGRLDFLGRRDHQVKVRGFRIELGEVESVLVEHPRVQEALSLVHSDPRLGDRLVAYYAGDGGRPVSSAGLRAFLRERLPTPMVPSLLVSLERLPRTPNGKLDRRRLPDPSAAIEAAREGLVPPRNETEEALAELWREVLRVEEVGVHQSFFDLGGHSLMAGQVVSRIAEKLGVELPVRVLFEQTTIAKLAETIDRRSGAGEETGARPSIERRSAGGSLDELLAELVGDGPGRDDRETDREGP